MDLLDFSDLFLELPTSVVPPVPPDKNARWDNSDSQKSSNDAGCGDVSHLSHLSHQNLNKARCAKTLQAANDPAETDRATLEALHPAIVEGVPLGLVLDQADPEDLADLANPAVLEAFARSLVATGTVKPSTGRQPPSDTEARQAPSTVRCADCRHFEPDTIGDGTGIGRCTANAWRQGQPALYPRAPRRCASHQPREGAA